MDPSKVAQALIATIVEDNPKASESEVDERIGVLIQALANERASRAQVIAQLKVEFFAQKQEEFEQFAATRISEKAEADAEAMALLTAPAER